MSTISKVLLLCLVVPIAAGCKYAELNGSIAGATATVAPLREPMNVLQSQKTWDKNFLVSIYGEDVWQGYGSFQKAALTGVFVLTDPGADPNSLYLVRVENGVDHDANLDGSFDENGTALGGTVHAIMTGAQLQDAANVNALTDAIYRYIQPDIDGMSNGEILAALNELASQVVSDVNGDGRTDYADVLSWNRLMHTASYSLDIGELNAITKAVLEGRSDDYIRNLIVGDSVQPPANSPPVARTSNYAAVYVGAQVSLDGSASYDPDGDSLTYRWTLIPPPGGTTEYFSSSSPYASFKAALVGRYTVKLEVSDGSLWSSPATAYVDSLPLVVSSAVHVVSEGYYDLTYLGCWTCNQYSSDSVHNEYGSYGSPYSASSIKNNYGNYGSPYSSDSACNSYASNPPQLWNESLTNYSGNLTINTYDINGICNKYSGYYEAQSCALLHSYCQ